jgi:protein gp37
MMSEIARLPVPGALGEAFPLTADQCAAEINAEALLLERSQRSMLASAFRIGDLLNYLKTAKGADGERLIEYGKFQEWCATNISIKHAQYAKYMKLAREIPEFQRSGILEAGTGVDSVYATLAGPGDDTAENRPYWTLDEWTKLTDKAKRKILAEAIALREGTQFNRQDDKAEDSMGNIEWASWSWNPVTGCKHSCSYCYARDIAERFYEQKFEPSFWPSRLAAPHATRQPANADIAHRNVFSNSMSDLYGRWVPDEWIDATLHVMRETPQWNYLMLTKFPKKAADFQYSENCWIGTSVDLQVRVKAAEQAFERIDCGVRWLSLEPMIEPLTFTRPELFQWVVIGGASRSSKTPEWTPPFEWIVRVANQFLEHGAKVYLKTNGRPREYPGTITQDRAPKVFYYLGRQ